MIKLKDMININQGKVSLPKPANSNTVSLEWVISQRLSKRNFRDRALSLQQISQILWAAYGVADKDREFRTAPSAGALYPLELYLVVGGNRLSDLNSAVYHFNHQDFVLEKVKKGDLRPGLALAALGQSVISQAPVSIVITAVYERTMQKYGERGERYVHMEAGHVAQNIYLQVTALDLGTVSIGAFQDQQVKELLGLTEEEPLYIMPIGFPK